MNVTTQDLQLFLLAWFRITGLLFAGPLFGSPAVPARVKAFFSFVFAVLYFPLLRREGIVVEPNVALYIVWVLLELGVGLLLGFAASLLFVGVQFGGQLIDQEMGLALANVFDPISNEQVSVIGQFKLFLATVVYLLIDGHHFLLSALAQSFQAVPLLGLHYTDAVAMHVSDAMVRDLFLIAVKVAAPALVTMALLTIAMAFMARTVPEMNIFIVGFALRLAVGFLVLALGVAAFVYGMERWVPRHEVPLRRLLELMGA